jgi:hypothetical protein
MKTSRINPADYLTISHAAELAGVSGFWMRQSVKKGSVPGVQIDGVWFVLRSAAEGFQRHPTAGRPRGSGEKA